MQKSCVKSKIAVIFLQIRRYKEKYHEIITLQSQEVPSFMSFGEKIILHRIYKADKSDSPCRLKSYAF